MHSASLPLVDGLVMPTSGLIIVSCPACRSLHAVQHGKIVSTPCGANYRLRIIGTASPQKQRELRRALATQSRKEAPNAATR
jgi:hypothetical protein